MWLKKPIIVRGNITGIRGGKTVDLREVREICKKQRVFLYTAIHPDTMLNGPPEKIEALMLNWIKRLALGRTWILYLCVIWNPFRTH